MATAKGGPRIDTILAVSGPRAGEPIEHARAGDVVRIVGAGFGDAPRLVRVRFGEVEARPFTVPFSGEELAVACPPVEAPTETVRVAVEEVVSEAYRFQVEPFETGEGQEGPPGAATREFVERVEEYAALTEALVRAVAEIEDEEGPVRENRRRVLRGVADHLAGTRRVLRRSHQVLGQWREMQAEIEFEPIRTIEMYDDLITRGGLIRSAETLIVETYGPDGIFSEVTEAAGGFAETLLAAPGRAAEALGSVSSSTWSSVGFGLHEASKVLEGAENVLKVIGTSASGGAGVEVDVHVQWGEGVSAVAKGIDFIAQLFQKWGEEGKPKIGDVIEIARKIQEDLGKMEEKSDRTEEKLGDLVKDVEKIEEKSDRTGEKIGQLEEKGDRAHEKLDQLEEKSDRTGEKLDKLEEKADRTGEKIDQIEEKADRSEEKLDKIEAKEDRAEEKLDKLEEKSDRAEEKLDRLEEKEDRIEEKLDRMEEKDDRAEEKLDQLEEKSDRLEEKSDRAEEKLDRLEEKEDRAEAKLDQLEEKNDRIEEKLDRIEEKEDRKEEKIDRLAPPFLPSEGSIANQRGGGDRVTGAVAAIRAQGNEVHLRAAIDVDRDELDEESAWSYWESFGRPSPSAVLREVSLDLQYGEGSDEEINGLLSVRDQAGRIFHRSFEGTAHDDLLEPDEWSEWEEFLEQP